MDIMQTKLPWLSAEWTVARGMKYLAKVGLFLYVPGLHQMASRRYILGGLLFALFSVSSFMITNRPYVHGEIHHLALWGFGTMEVARNFSWFLMALDARGLDERNFSFGYFPLAAIIALLGVLPLHNHGILYLHIVKDSPVCSKICENDILSFNIVSDPKHPPVIGDYVLLGWPISSMTPTRIVMTRPRIPCLDGYHGGWTSKLDSYLCSEGYRNYFYDYLVIAKPGNGYPTANGIYLKCISAGAVFGTELRKIGNIRDYDLFTDDATDIFGHALLTIYKWTGINLFKGSTLNQKPTPREEIL
jgi:hypothetical protein